MHINNPKSNAINNNSLTSHAYIFTLSNLYYIIFLFTLTFHISFLQSLLLQLHQALQSGNVDKKCALLQKQQNGYPNNKEK